MHSSVMDRPVRKRTTVLAAVLALALSLGFLVVLPPDPAEAATCPCTIFTPAQVPTVAADPETVPIELGVKFRADQAGFVSGIRFYKGTGNTGTHTGSLWSSTGTQLATVTFTGETATGWQQATFASPVAVNANTTYIASYYAPNGRYAADDGYYANSGVTNPPLTALQNGVDGGNGVYRYGSGGGFPNSSFSSTNYWVDLVFNPSGADTTKPTVSDREPAAGATGVAVTTTVEATFSEPVQESTITMTLTAGSGVAASKSYDSGTRTITLTPNANLAPSTTYTVNVSGAQDSADNEMDPVTWTFTTAAAATGCPCTIWPNTTVPATAAAADNSAVELGVKFRASQAGYITGIRFYKGTGNTGTHVGSVWTSQGNKLGSVTFTGESATGWQQATFSAPLPVTANATYVASYYAPVGRYAVNQDYFTSAATTRGPLTALRDGTDGPNGLYRYGASGFPTSSFRSSNYWVDVVFDSSVNDTAAPTVVARVPAPGSSGVAVGTSVSATFSEAIVSGSAAMELRRPDNTLVPASTAYNSGSQTASLTPNAPLANSTTYTATVSGARDSSNNTMTAVTWSFTTAAPPPPPPDQGPGGPIAVVTSNGNLYSKYLAEILRTEGLNEFATIDVATLSASTLAAYDVVVLGSVAVTAAQASTLTSWVNGGGNLIAMKPNSALSSLLGISAATGSAFNNAYLKVDPATAPGAGIVAETIQYHGPADRYALSGAQAIAAIHSNATTATTFPAVTLRDVGTNGGQAAAFTFDLPRSIALTRQGNPAWVGMERDGQSPIRSDDLFFGGGSTDWINLSKAAIPQADEQQRLLANLIQVMNRDKKPLPRFWYFPRDIKAVVIATGDDHGNGGTAGRFDQYAANSPSGCSVSDWTCLRSSSYVYPGTPLSDSAAVSYTNSGFEVGIHPSTNCANYTPTSIASVYANQLASWKSFLPSVPSPGTSRLHCIVFSDWSSQPKVELANGIRMDDNYYYWPGSWIQNRPGFMTGSGMPMRFADTDGTMIDIYQSMTQMTDESGQVYPFTPDTLLDNAVGPKGYYGAFNVNMHTDAPTIPENDALIASAQAHGVPIVSGRQMLNWIDGRNGSTYGSINWNANTLSFTVGVGAGANGLTGMLPTAGPNGTQLASITRGGNPVTYTTSTVKGLEYATFSATGGSYSATYSAPAPLAIAAATSSTELTEEDASTATVAWKTNNVATSEVLLGTSPDRLSQSEAQQDSTRQHSLDVAELKPGTKYYYRVVSTDITGKEQTYPDPSQAPASFTAAAADNVEPKATAPTVTALPGGTAVLRWTTSEATTAVVGLGENASKVEERARVVEPVREHSVVLSGLSPDTAYWVNAESTDVAGNKVSSKAIRFVTPAWGVAEQMTASFKRGTFTGASTVDEADLGSITLAGIPTTARTGTFVSGVLDAQAMVDWGRAIWHADVPTGTKLVISVRTGSTLKPDSTWSDWSTLTTKGQLTGSSRYIQYKIKMTSAVGTAAPVLYGIGFSHDGAQLPPVREGS